MSSATFIVSPGANIDVTHGYAAAMVKEGFCQLFMGSEEIAVREPKKYTCASFAGRADCSIRKHYLRRLPAVGDTVVMRDRSGPVYFGTVQRLEERIRPWSEADPFAVYYKPALRNGKAAAILAADSQGLPQEDYMLYIHVDWKQIANPTEELTEWCKSHCKAAIQRVKVPMPVTD